MERVKVREYWRRGKKFVNPTPMVWEWECPFCGAEDEDMDAMFYNEPVKRKCYKCGKTYYLEIDTSKI